MGILHTREEYLPVTCAVLKPEDRDGFFSSIKKLPGGKPDQLARLCQVTADLVADWLSGKANVPYHSLQMLAHHFNVAPPPVGELRREYQAVTQAKPARREPQAPARPAPAGRAKPAGQRGEKPLAQRPGAAAPQGGRPPKAAKTSPRGQRKPQERRRAQAAAPRAPKLPTSAGPVAPKPSEDLSYWAGALLAAAERRDSAVVFSADRRIGQNFAAIWANLTKALFGVKPALEMKNDGKVQEACLPTGGLEEFFDRLEFKAGEKAADGPGIPRWVWSNASWKKACLKGIVDASSHFHRTPALILAGLGPRLTRSVTKILGSLDLKAETGPEPSLQLKGRETVEKYFDMVGAGNLKLRDQFNAYRRSTGRSAPALVSPTEEGAGAQAPAEKPAAPKRPSRRRAVYRGRPGS